MTHYDQKAGEQRIYIGMEETITDVRERLAQNSSENIILVVPPQTQLRHAIAWKVLARWVQEQGKQIAIASSDRQIRALAHSAEFVLIPAELPIEHQPRTAQQEKKRGRAS